MCEVAEVSAGWSCFLCAARLASGVPRAAAGASLAPADPRALSQALAGCGGDAGLDLVHEGAEREEAVEGVRALARPLDDERRVAERVVEADAARRLVDLLAARASRADRGLLDSGEVDAEAGDPRTERVSLGGGHRRVGGEVHHLRERLTAIPSAPS